MKLSGRMRMLIGVLAGLALISVAVMATQGSERATPAATVALADHPACDGQCATCPHAGTENCPRATTGDGDAAPTVDADRCIGCVRCVNVAPGAFRIIPETGKAEVIEGASAAEIALGAKACPVNAVIQ